MDKKKLIMELILYSKKLKK